VADKQLAIDLSSGDAGKFAGAVRQMLDRGLIRQTPPDEAVEKIAKEIIASRAKGGDVVAVSSVHRISEALAERIHDFHVEKMGREGQTPVDVHIKRDLQPAELRSSQFYKIGDVVEYKQDDTMVRAPVVSVQPEALRVEHEGQAQQLLFRHVRAVFDRSRIERGPGERLLLQGKIKQSDQVFEKGSRQTIARFSSGVVHFESGLRLRVDDGRVRQGDCLTDYKAQGIKGAEVRGIEDNGSAMVMANKEAFHVKGTRHVKNLVLHVENASLYVEAIQRSNEKFSALQLERSPVLLASAVVAPLNVDRSRLRLQVCSWGREFLPHLSSSKRKEQVRRHVSRHEALRPRGEEIVTEKATVAPAPVAAKAVTEKLTPAVKEAPLPAPTERLTPSVEDMAQKLDQKPKESLTPKPVPRPRKRHRIPVGYRPASPSRRQGHRMGM
jgi:hypothetical protein